MNAFAIALRRRARRGLALFDVILAVGVIGFLIAGGVLLLQNVNERVNRNDTLALVNTIRSEVNRIYAGRPTVAGLNVELLWNRGSLPDSVYRGTSTTKLTTDNADADLKHAYDGLVRVWPLTGSKRFTVGLADLDDGPCSDILSPWIGKTRTRAGILSVGVGNQTGIATTAPGLSTAMLITGPTGIETHAAPFEASDVDGFCDQDDGNNDIYIVFQG